LIVIKFQNSKPNNMGSVLSQLTSNVGSDEDGMDVEQSDKQLHQNIVGFPQVHHELL